MRAVPLGTTLPLGSGGDLGEAGLLALVLAPDRAVLTATAWLAEPGPSARHPGRPPAPLPLGALVATDEHGAQYQAGHAAQPDYGRWSVAFELTPVPPPGTRRLDITGPAINDPIRVELARTPGSAFRGQARILPTRTPPARIQGGPIQATPIPRAGAGSPAA